MKLMLVVVLGLVVLLMPQEGRSECCRQFSAVTNKCLDCSFPNPWCGYGPCNAIGCDCQGGCRIGNCANERPRGGGWGVGVDVGGLFGRRSVTPQDLIASVDADGDGRLSLDEAQALVPWEARSKRFSGLIDMDTDNDGYLSVHEMDKDYYYM